MLKTKQSVTVAKRSKKDFVSHIFTGIICLAVCRSLSRWVVSLILIAAKNRVSLGEGLGSFQNENNFIYTHCGVVSWFNYLLLRYGIRFRGMGVVLSLYINKVKMPTLFL